MSGCVFCDILEGTAEASIAYQDGVVAAFMDIQPVTPGHLLVVPRRHLPRLADLDEHTANAMLGLARRLADAIYASPLPCEGINLFLADGEAAGQEVFHTHLHVIPRSPGDGFGLSGSWRRISERAELDSTATLIRAAME